VLLSRKSVITCLEGFGMQEPEVDSNQRSPVR
jgi:hypothetical protein